MLRLIPLFLLFSCATTPDPQPSDTKFDERKRNWVEIFQHEINIAIQNGDADAYHFFMQELIKERNKFLIEEIRIWNEHEQNNSKPSKGQ